jgi:hypothetical protein
VQEALRWGISVSSGNDPNAPTERDKRPEPVKSEIKIEIKIKIK